MMLVQTMALFVALVCAACVISAAKKARRPVLRVLGSTICGVAALGAVNFLGNYTGISIALNYATSFVTIVLGAPGVVLLLLLRALLLF